MFIFILYVLLFGAAFSCWKAREYLPYEDIPQSEVLDRKKITEILQFLFTIAVIVVGIKLFTINFWLVILGVALVATPLVGHLVVMVANFLLIFPIVLLLAWITSKRNEVREEYPKPTPFRNKHKIAPDIARTLLVFYELIKKDKPTLEGERLYETVLATWNLNLSSARHIKIKETMEKARRLNWGDDLNLRKVAWALAMEEYFIFSSQRELGKAGEDISGKESPFVKDGTFIFKMRDQIGKIIPEGI